MLLGEDRFFSFYHQDGACGVADRYSFSGSSVLGATMTGALARYVLSSSKALSASGVHLNVHVFFMILKKGSAHSPNLEMK